MSTDYNSVSNDDLLNFINELNNELDARVRLGKVTAAEIQSKIDVAKQVKSFMAQSGFNAGAADLNLVFRRNAPHGLMNMMQFTNAINEMQNK